MESTHQPVSPLDLYNRIKDFHIVRDAGKSDLTLEQILDAASEVTLVSAGFRRYVYRIKSAFGTFFLKYSPVFKKKDRLRFWLLPWRMKTEWRNLARLKKKAVPVPERACFGYKGRGAGQGFFLVTEEAGGAAVDRADPDQICRLAAYLAGLHAKGVYHRDFHPGNVRLSSTGAFVLLDVQEVYIFPRLPRRLKVLNLGQCWWHIAGAGCPVPLETFLNHYNQAEKTAALPKEIEKAASRRRQRYYRSRAKRCFKNSSEFRVVKDGRDLQGFRRRDFSWGKAELRKALEAGRNIKDNKLIAYEGVCVKIHPRRLLHGDRCLNSWKMSRALAVRGVEVPPALAYYRLPEATCFLARFYEDSLTLNEYFSSVVRRHEKKAFIRQFAVWLRRCHDLAIWQRDFKSSNVLVYRNQFLLVDLEGVRICRRLSWRRKVINLAQLNASLSNRLTLKDRLRFFHIYCGADLPPRKKRRKIYRKIWEITQKKNTLPFDLDPEKFEV